MKRNPVMRRLLAGAATLAVGMVGAVALATPAQATQSHEGPEGQNATIIYKCDKTKVKVDAGGTNRNWAVNGTEQWLGFGDHHTWELDADADVQIQWQHNGVWKDFEPKHIKEYDKRDDCPGGELTSRSNCDLLAVHLQNTGGKTLTMVAVASHDTVGGNLRGAGPEIPEDTELHGAKPIPAGDHVQVWTGELRTSNLYGFEGVEGLEVRILVYALDGTHEIKDENLVLDETHTWTPGDCEVPGESDDEGVDGGEGGEEEDEQLPVTGSSTMLIAAGALVMLALGGGLFLIARRRRVSFTA